MLYKLWMHYHQHSYSFSDTEWGTKALKARGNDCREVILIYLIEHSQTTVTKMKLQCSISSRYFCLCFSVYVYGLVVKPVNTTISAEAVKLHSLFHFSGWCPISINSRRVSERKVYAHRDHCASWSYIFFLGCKECSRAILPRQNFQLGWAEHVLKEGPQVSGRYIYFCDFVHFCLSKGMAASGWFKSKSRTALIITFSKLNDWLLIILRPYIEICDQNLTLMWPKTARALLSTGGLRFCT